LVYRQVLITGLILLINQLQGQDFLLAGRVLHPDAEKPSLFSIQLVDNAKSVKSVNLNQGSSYRFQSLYPGNYELYVTKIDKVIFKKSIQIYLPITNLDIDLNSLPSAKIEITDSLYMATDISLAKLKSPIKELPQTIIVIPSSIIEETGSRRLDQALVNVSGVVPSSSSNGGFFDHQLIRGLNATYTREGLIDGPTFMGYARSLADVEQIEVFKGPGSALFGSAGGGGTINLTMKKPKRDSVTIGDLSLGSFDSFRGIVDSTGPINERWSYRVIGNIGKSDGFRKLSSSTNEWTGSLLWLPTEFQSILLTIENRHLKLTPDAAGIPFRMSSYRNSSGNYPFHDPTIIDVDKNTSYVSPMASSVTDIFRISLSYSHRLGTHLRWETNLAYGTRSLDLYRNWSVPDFKNSAGAPILSNRYLRRQHDRFTDKSLQTFVTWQGDLGGYGHKIQLGADVFKSDISTNRRHAKFAPILDAYNPILPETGADLTNAWAWIFNRSISARQSGLYVTDQWTISDFLKIRTSLRQDHYFMIDEGLYNNLGNNSFTELLNSGGQFYTPILGLNNLNTALTKENPLTTNTNFNNGQIGLVFDPAHNMSFFIGTSWGRLANLTTKDPRTATLPESNRQLELGNRLQWFENKLNLTLSIFRTIRFNVDELTLVSGNLIVTQTPEQRVDGLDLDFRARPLSGWFILAAWSWMKPIYTEPSTEELWLKGQQLPGAPKRTGRLWSSYEIQEGDWRGWGIGLGFRHRDNIKIIFRDGPPNSIGIIPGYNVLDAGIFYRAQSWDIQLNLKNLSDQTYWSYGIINAAVPGEGRNMTLDFRYRF